MIFLHKVNVLFFATIFLCLSCTLGVDEKEIDFDANLASLSISTEGQTIQDEPKINARLLISVNDKVQYDGNIAIEIRGSSSQRFPKKSYGFETRNDNNEDHDVSLLNLPAEEDWILHGPYTDKTLIRNKFMYDLSRSLGIYASRTVFVDLTINDSYQGLYILMEKLKRDNNRINISKVSDHDVTGGYVLKIDRKEENFPEASFTSSYPPPFATRGQQVTFVFEEPSHEEITPDQKAYIINYISDFENALNSDDFADPESGYSSFINTSTFVDYFLFNELANNVDAFRLSTYLTKDKDKKLSMGPIWDFNYALGNVDFCEAGRTDIWAYTFNERCGNHNQQVPFWWARFMEDPAFVNQLKTRWNELRESKFTESNFNQMIDSYSEFLRTSEAAKRNFQVWDILGLDVHPNNFVGETYDQEIDYLKDWLKDRLTWLDEAIENLE